MARVTKYVLLSSEDFQYGCTAETFLSILQRKFQETGVSLRDIEVSISTEPDYGSEKGVLELAFSREETEREKEIREAAQKARTQARRAQYLALKKEFEGDS